MIEFTVPAVPVAQPRQRHRVVTVGGKTFSTNYTPQRSPVNEFKATIRMAAQQAYSGPPLEGPLRVDVVFVFPRPRSKVWKSRPMPRYRHISKPDRDNADKAVLDALAGLLFVDDCQVCAGEPEKWVAAGDEQPHVLVKIEPLEAGT